MTDAQEQHLTAHERVSQMTGGPTGPLQGIRVLDCTQAIAGPWSTMMLADLGADVIKIEPPRGDMQRPMAPYTREDQERAYGGSFGTYNRNKRGIVLDLFDEGDRATFMELVDTADAVVENMRAGVMDKMGCGWEVLHARNPRLVYGAIRGFGDPRTGESPYADWPAYDVIAQSMGGLVAQNGTGPDNRIQVGPFVGDIYPGTVGAVGILAAIVHAQRTGEGQFVDVGMVDSMMALSEMGMMRYSYMGAYDTPPSGNRSDLIAPFDVFDTKDGQVAIASPTDKHFYILAEAMGHPEWIEAEEGRTLRGRMRNREMIDTALADWCASLTNAQVLDAIGGRVPCGPVNLPGDLFSDPHVTAREMLVAVEQPSGRPIVQVASPIKMTATPTGVHRRAPRLGEHTEEILAELEQAKQRFQA